ncbi:MAG: sugar phosphate nucleotidyltransferase [Dehalococcoidales bacterium]|nr:sugar phosphate nucleotidyltransferase [Dehalococcoidales bacterium]
MKQAIILAAGEGWRLRPFTVNRPKVMLPVAGKPILRYLVEALAQNGIRNIVMVVGYKREQIFDYMVSGEHLGVDITYVTQKERLGTAHALDQAREAAQDEFLVLSGDKLIEAATIARFVTVKPAAVLVKRVEHPERYGVANIVDGVVRDIVEQPKEAGSNTVMTRIYAFGREVFDYIEAELSISAVLNKMIGCGKTIYACETDGPWLEAVYPWDMLGLNSVVILKARAEMGGTVEKGVSLKGQVSVGRDTVIRANSSIVGPVVIGDGCDIGPNACILPATSIGDNVIVSPFSEIKNSVIGSDVAIATGGVIQDSVVGNGCAIGGHFTALSGEAEVKVNDSYHSVKMGAMLGEGCSIGSGVVAQPGTILGNYSEVQALKLIRGRLPDKSLVF